MKYLPRIELVLALAALALALIAGLFLAVTTFAQHETCYGISADNIKCHPITGNNVGDTVVRVVFILSIVLALYVAGALAAWGQGRAVKPDSRLTAYMALLTCALTNLGVTLPAISGVGFFFVPATIVLLLAPVAGLPPLIETYRAAARARTRKTSA
ncbi:MAG TPA: hypothetical protein VF116_09400 [Ktedonobacterales bacterium]